MALRSFYADTLNYYNRSFKINGDQLITVFVFVFNFIKHIEVSDFSSTWIITLLFIQICTFT